MSGQGQLTIYDKSGAQVAGFGNNGQQAAQFPGHSVIAFKDGIAKRAFFYSGPDGSINTHRAMNLVDRMESR